MPNDKIKLFSRPAQRKTIVEHMPTIGIAGVTLPGATDCVAKINRAISRHNEFPSHHHPNIAMLTPNFGPTHEAQNENNWEYVEDRIVETANQLATIGAAFVVIPANTVHSRIEGIKRRSNIPVISMLDVVTEACQKQELKRVGVLGTRWTMAGHLYKEAFVAAGIMEIIPSPADQDIIQRAIFEELIPTGKITDATMTNLLEVVERVKQMGCDGLALACTELPLVLNNENCNIPTIDTTDCLANAAVEKAAQLYTERLRLSAKL